MQRPSWFLRIALWAVVCAVLLKSAMPMLATVSAQAQGKNLVEVCTVYGVATVVLDEQGQRLPAPASDHGPPHSGDHCALSALMAFAAPEPSVLALQDAPRAASLLRQPVRSPPPAHDACAGWAARLRHGPPAVA